MKLTLFLFSIAPLLAQRVAAPGQINRVSGNGRIMATTTGPQTSGNCVTLDANGNHVASSQPCNALATSAKTLVSTTFELGGLVTGTSFPTVRGSNIASGDVDLYTVPTGKRLLVTLGGGYNASAGTITWYIQAKIAGTYYRLSPNVSAPTHTLLGAVAAQLVFEPGESFSVNTNAAGLNVSYRAIQFDSSSSVRTVKLMGLTSGDNILYTVPAGKTALFTRGPTWANPGGVNFVADGGATRNIRFCVAPAGGPATCAANSATEYFFSPAAPNNRAAQPTSGHTMNAGDFIVINVDVGDPAQIAWITVVEGPTS